MWQVVASIALISVGLVMLTRQWNGLMRRTFGSRSDSWLSHRVGPLVILIFGALGLLATVARALSG